MSILPSTYAMVPLLTHLCLACVQLLFGTTAVVGKLGLRASNPVAFTVWRFVLAVPCLVASQRGLRLPPRSCVPALLLGAAALVGGNLGITLGIALSGQVTASAWQPLQLFFTAAISFILGTETISARKLVGLAFGLTGALIIVVTDPSLHMWPSVDQVRSFGSDSALGHAALLINTMSSGSLFVIRRRLVIQGGLAPMFIVTWLHIIASPLLLLFGLAAGSSESLRVVICGGCSSLLAAPAGTDVWLALAFYTLAPTIICQSGSAWAAKTADPSTMAMYAVLQPVASATLSAVLRALAPHLQDVLAPPAANLLGALPVIIGLRLVTYDPKSKHS